MTLSLKDPKPEFSQFFVTPIDSGQTAPLGERSNRRLESSTVLHKESLKSTEINVETFRGAVQLSGFVSSRAAVDKAVEIARGVKGVTSVKNDMRVK